ncbi:dienelactone hydrolase family protein [Chitinophaga cymbidii]|uniref:Dienelactone hydrolase n=1 Tax=Chitinophaga cymbidii TaxID=1096750 RepID=A0A512RQ52_9BACT|nr:dienelactone hydrolase family protein [Chitinophaga cymbidii]GEP97822.1 dienelactone hydrolase [Chitinophaga cymbidii]
MKTQTLLCTVMLAAVIGSTACNNRTASTETATDSTTAASAIKLKEATVTYKDDTATLIGYVVYNEASEQPRPGVLVVPEWWGLDDYTRSRARQLAELGYIALAVDMYGNGRHAATPDEAGKTAGAFYTNAALIKSRMAAALAEIKTFSQTDTSRIAAIGYCFGGAMVLNAAKMGLPFNGVVSFHGSLAGVTPDKDLLKSKILVCHGGADKFISPEEEAQFKKGLDSIGADYTFKSYPGALHAFSNPAATATGKKFNLPIAYNAAADSASWQDMKAFFGKIF